MSDHVTIDFETYSEAGYVYNKYTRKWESLLNANKRGLNCVTPAVYAKHPSTRILSLAYDLGNGSSYYWLPQDPFPIGLSVRIKNGEMLEAWNVAFERWIWEEIGVKRHGFPQLPSNQWRCAAAKSRAHALPGKLADAGRVLELSVQKNKNGTRLINKFCIPRHPTAKDDRLFILPEDDKTDAELLYQYNVDDVKAEIAISERVPDLSPFELKFWQCDQEINHRGVQIDVVNVLNCINIVQQAHAKYNAELSPLTDGAVTVSSQTARIVKWMDTLGVKTSSLDKEHIIELLKNPLLLPQIRRVLEIRQLIGSAAVKKLYAMLNQSTNEGRLHDLFIYHSAHTGRAAGVGVQPQNLPRGQEGFDVEQALQVISSGCLKTVEDTYCNAVSAVSNCLRGMFIAKPGHELIASDYSAIEGVVLAELAGESWRQEVFRSHGKIYEMSASKITGTALDEMIAYKNLNGKHHPSRKIGKVAELACFDSTAIVLTRRGYVPIIDVSIDDELWDGLQWIKHQGVVCKGKKRTIVLDGVKMTANHPIYLGNDTPWESAEAVLLNECLLARALVKGSEKLPLQGKKEKNLICTKSWLDVIVAKKNITSTRLNFCAGKVKNAVHAPLNLEDTPPLMKMLFPIPHYVKIYLSELITRYSVATTPKNENILITAVGGYKSVMTGENPGIMAKDLFYNMLSLLKTGTRPIWKWIESITTGATNLGISASYHVKKTTITDECYETLKNESMSLSPVYDIAHAGPNNRFTIKTDSGHLIVHNSGYAGWIGAWLNFKADEFLTEEEIKRAILAWRDASPAIVEFWGGQRRGYGPPNQYFGVEGAAIQAVLYPGQSFYAGNSYRCDLIEFQTLDDILYCTLLSGRKLTYHKPRLELSTRREGTYELSFEGWNTNPKNGAPGWHRQSTYSGKLVENITQAVARDILANAIVNLEDAGYPVVLHIHDEIIAEVPQGAKTLEEFERIMSTMPAWAEGWPVFARGGWVAKRYCK